METKQETAVGDIGRLGRSEGRTVGHGRLAGVASQHESSVRDRRRLARSLVRRLLGCPNKLYSYGVLLQSMASATRPFLLYFIRRVDV